ncbi:Cellulose synthase operon protein C [Rhodovastum atsumiense]|nr:tetratricopeptide repeat protein [Rhodovastum atsumiense]CAH2602375.1 Cellulose synthase operon protein C [Rhodovastum atsumiense]
MPRCRPHPRGTVLLVALLAVMIAGLPPAGAQIPPQGQPQPQQPASLLAQIYQNALFWENNDRPELALQEAERALGIWPANPDLLAMAARLSSQLGHDAAAETYRRQLREVAPGDTALAAAAERPLGPAERATLEEARKLAAAGRSQDALRLYRRLWQGKVPENLATEYYLVLGSSSPEGFATANTELARAAERQPLNIYLRLAYARLQTFQEGTRPAGMRQLRELNHQPLTAQAARDAWREALLWQGANAETEQQLTAYLQDYPDDTKIVQRRDEVHQTLQPNRGPMARIRGYEAHAQGKLAEAEREFRTALAEDPEDAETMVFLGMMLRRQNRQAEATKLIERAFALAPDRRDEFRATLGETAAAAARAQYAQVNRLADQGKYDQAERLLRQLMQKDRNAGNYLTLGNIQLRAGRLAEAEENLRRAVQMAPGNADAVLGLADALARQGRGQEADALYAQAQELFTRSGNRTGLQALRRSRAERLRVQATKLDDADARIALLRSGLALDPGHAWLRLDLARDLLKQGQRAEAKQVMAGALAGDRADPDALQAAIAFAQDTDDLALANQLIARLPARNRTRSMQDLQERQAIQEQVRQAADATEPEAARARLLALAAAADPNGVRGSTIGRTLLRMGDKAGMRAAIRAALASTTAPTSQQRIAYAGVLLEGGMTQDARTLLRGIDRASLPVALRGGADQLMNGIAVQQADRLNEQGRPAEAFDVLAPRLAGNAADPGLNLALGRLYQKNGKPEEARSITDTLLQRSPDSIEVRLAALDLAIQQHDFSRAGRLLAETRDLFPGDPRTYVASARLARAQGRTGAAIDDLERARELRERQLR